MRITTKYFASLREALACDEETLELPAEVQTVGQVRQLLQTRGGAFAEAFHAARPVRAALNFEMVDEHARIVPNAELAFFPPVTGG